MAEKNVLDKREQNKPVCSAECEKGRIKSKFKRTTVTVVFTSVIWLAFTYQLTSMYVT